MDSEKKFTVIAKRWFDKVNGNTYHSVRVIRLKDNRQISQGFTYGYGDHYRQTALGLMGANGWLPEKYNPKPGFNNTWYRYERDNDYPINWDCSDGLESELTENAKL